MSSAIMSDATGSKTMLNRKSRLKRCQQGNALIGKFRPLAVRL